MNIQTTANKPQYLSFNGAKKQIFKKNFLKKNATLKDKFVKANKNTNNFVFTYDRLLKECEDINIEIQKKNKDNANKTLKDLLIQQLNLLMKTCYFSVEREKIRNKDIYKKIIENCFADIDIAVQKGEPQEKINQLAEILEMFVTKYSHYGK